MKAIIIVFLSILAYNLQAQNLITVQNGSNIQFFHTVDEAITSATDNDTIYIPGGTWMVYAVIDKPLHLIGVGSHPDSSSATITSTLTGFEGKLNLYAGAANGSITGMRLNLYVNAVQAITNYVISRCNLNSVNLCDGCSNFSFIENIFQTGMGQPYTANITNCAFYNNVFTLGFSFRDVWNYNIAYKNCVIKNNIFLGNNNPPWYPIITQYSIIENNIFIGTGSMYQVKNSQITNNLFVEEVYIDQSLNSWSNNISAYTGSIFNNQSGNQFNYSHDYHLSPECPGNNAGTDGTDIGIYGGIFPWKEGSIPQNPHIKFKNISGATDQNGNINVNIGVAAQDN